MEGEIAVFTAKKYHNARERVEIAVFSPQKNVTMLAPEREEREVE